MVDYDPEWRCEFERLRAVYLRYLKLLTIDVQHVGSTSVPGLAAKPIIDIDIIVDSEEMVGDAIEALRELGYIHIGDQGVAGREAFERASAAVPYWRTQSSWLPHHLYVCVDGCTSVQNHLVFRDYLRSSPDAAQAYGRLKKELAQTYEYDVDMYCENKTPFVARILARAGLAEEDVRDIVGQNIQLADQ